MEAAIPRRRRLATRLYALALVFAVVLLAIRIGVLVTNRALRDASLLAENSQGVAAAAGATERLTVDLETGLRGWQLTGDDALLEPTRRALAQLPVSVRHLQGLVRANPLQAARARRLGNQIASYAQAYIAPAIARGAVLTRAERRAATAEGKRRLDAIRDGFAVLTASEARRAASRARDARKSSDRAQLTGIVGLAVVLVLLGAGVLYLSRSVIAPVVGVARAAARIAAGDLRSHPPPGPTRHHDPHQQQHSISALT